MGFSRQENWSRLPCHPPKDFPDPGIKLTSLKSPALAGGSLTTSTTWEAQDLMTGCIKRIRIRNVLMIIATSLIWTAFPPHDGFGGWSLKRRSTSGVFDFIFPSSLPGMIHTPAKVLIELPYHKEYPKVRLFFSFSFFLLNRSFSTLDPRPE